MGYALNSFKKLKNVVVAIAIPLTLISMSACSYLNDGKKKQDEARQLNMGDAACVQDTKKILTDYLDGKEKIEKVDGMFNCLIHAIDTFTSRTQGSASSDGYTYNE